MNIERAALLKIRTAMRFRFDEHKPASATRSEALEEQSAASVATPRHVFDALVARGLAERCYGAALRLTDAGTAMLASERTVYAKARATVDSEQKVMDYKTTAGRPVDQNDYQFRAYSGASSKKRRRKT